MKEKKIGRIIILLAFALIICLSHGIWFFTEKYVDTENYENRQMAESPRLTVDSYTEFPKAYSDYFNDHLQFRNPLITLHREIDYFVFRRSSTDNVIVGENNWLFYSKKEDGDPLGDYLGTKIYTEEQLQALADNCVRQRDFLQEQGKEFVIFIAPNKERIYYEYMPAYYGPPATKYRVLQIYQYLKENTDLRIVYPYEALMQAKQDVDMNIYFKTDTHWNYIGAYVGARELNAELGIELPSLTSGKITITKGDNTAGDLSNMLNMREQLTFADHVYTITGYNTHNMETIENEFYGAFIYRATDADPRKIYVIRDSFSSHMAPYIGSQFNDSYMRHYASYSYENLVEQNPDIVVYQVVERRVHRLMNFSIQ